MKICDLKLTKINVRYCLDCFFFPFVGPVYEEVWPQCNIMALAEYPSAIRRAKLCFPPPVTQNC